MYRSLEPEKIILGPMTITKLEGNVDVGQMDSVAINCYPEFVGSQEEQIVLVVPDTIPQDKDGKIITLSVTSSIPCIDFQNFDAMFHENYVVERIQDFDCFNDVRIEYTRIPLINRSRKRSYYTEFVAQIDPTIDDAQIRISPLYFPCRSGRTPYLSAKRGVSTSGTSVCRVLT